MLWQNLLNYIFIDMTLLEDLFCDWDDNEIDCLCCGHTVDVTPYIKDPLPNVLQKLKCSKCSSKKFFILGSDMGLNGIYGHNIELDGGLITSISYPVLACYGRLGNLEVMCEETIAINGSIKRAITSYSLGDDLISEEYDLKGNLISAEPHDLLRDFYYKNRLLPVKKISNTKVSFRMIEIDYEDDRFSQEEKNKRFIIDRESEWLLEIPFEDLEEKNNKLTTKEGMYDWGNMGPTHTGFVNKAINSNGDFQRLYIVDGEIFEQHPVWTFNKESKLLSLDCNIGDEIFNLFKYK